MTIAALAFPPLTQGVFLARETRFTALVELDGRQERAHLGTSGRLVETLAPGRTVYLAAGNRPGRRTAWELVLTRVGRVLVSVDSHLPNRLVAVALQEGRLPPWRDARPAGGLGFGASRLDFHLRGGGPDVLLEVKSVTLVADGVAMFPDAPTRRGAVQMADLARAGAEGYRAAVLFVIQRGDARVFRPADHIDPAFGDALRQARARGVDVYARRLAVSLKQVALDGGLPLDL
ncbi:MAG: DNA/RNA nuclease SfsA [Peptococcaceae bacterium]|jgi:sugar fermentation stimulation protein A|nr:DNA/RNA nuclease SfsA [Peptococcaceae bacterium]